jgi:hypothetical protein
MAHSAAGERCDFRIQNKIAVIRTPDHRYPLDKMNKADGLDLLRGTPDAYSKMIIFDPQYREVLDQLKYGGFAGTASCDP